MSSLSTRLGLDRPAAQWSLVAASVIVVALGVRTMMVARALQREVQDLQSANGRLQQQLEERAALRVDQPPREAAPAQPAGRERAVSFTLSAGLPKTGGPPVRLTLTEDTEVVRLELNLPVSPAYERYRLGLRGAPGDEFWSQGRLQPEQAERGPVLHVLLPGRALAPGHYELALQAQAASAQSVVAGYYYFEIARP